MSGTRGWILKGAALAVMFVGATAAAENLHPAGLATSIGENGADRDAFMRGQDTQATTWQAGTEALFLTRNRAEWMPLSGIIANGLGRVRIVQSTRDLEFDYETGARLTLARQIDPCNRIELTYFGLHDFDASTEGADADGGLFSPFSQFDPFSFGFVTGFDGANFHRFDYGSDIHSAECNIRHGAVQSGCVAANWLVGLRYVRITEAFSFRSIEVEGGFGGADARGVYQISTQNDLLGGQLGCELTYEPTERLHFGAEASAGLFVNVAGHNSTFVQDLGPGFVNQVDFGDSGESLAGLLEVGLSATYQLTSCVTLRGGYDVFFLSGLALAPEQFDVNVGYFGSSVNDRGATVYHGPSVGLTVVW